MIPRNCHFDKFLGAAAIRVWLSCRPSLAQPPSESGAGAIRDWCRRCKSGSSSDCVGVDVGAGTSGSGGECMGIAWGEQAETAALVRASMMGREQAEAATTVRIGLSERGITDAAATVRAPIAEREQTENSVDSVGDDGGGSAGRSDCAGGAGPGGSRDDCVSIESGAGADGCGDGCADGKGRVRE